MVFRICSFAWTDDNERSGSNHVCGEERGHVGEHDCLTCHATLAQDAAVNAVTIDGNHFVEKAVGNEQS